MPQIVPVGFSQVLRADTSKFRLQKDINVRKSVKFRAHIREDLKAGATLPTKFNAALTPNGVSVDVTA